MILTIEQVEAVLQATVSTGDSRDAETILSHILMADAWAASAAEDAVACCRMDSQYLPPIERNRAADKLLAAVEYREADKRARKIERRAAALAATAVHERQTAAAMMRGKP
jgi:hypothetical protein